MRGSRLLRLLLLSMNLLLALALLLSDLAPYIDPNTLLFPAFLGLVFLPLFALNIVFVLFWLIVRPNYVLFGIIVIAISIPNLLNHVNFGSGVDKSGDIKAISFNVRLFDLYNWTNNKETPNNILDFFVKEDADIIYTVNAREPKHYPEDIAEAAILFHLAGENWTITAFASNLTDEKYPEEIIPAPEFGV